MRLVIILLGIALLVAACTPATLYVCDPPYINHGEECCLDRNENRICDSDEEMEKAPVMEEKPTKEESPPMEEPKKGIPPTPSSTPPVNPAMEEPPQVMEPPANTRCGNRICEEGEDYWSCYEDCSAVANCGQACEDELPEGGNQLYTLNEFDYDLNVLGIDDDEAKFEVNSNYTDPLTEGEFDILENGLKITILEIFCDEGQREGCSVHFGLTHHTYCGDTKCKVPEDADNCPMDCPAVCGDTFCTHEENVNECNRDCPIACGDSFCNFPEDAGSCPEDC